VDDVIGYDFLNKSNQPFDDHGHGTQIAGIITGQSTNNILPNSSTYDSVAIVPIKYTDKAGRGSIFHATCGIYYASDYWSANAADSNRVKVVNASWGYYGEPNPTLRKAMDYAADNCGMLFVCAAGNSGLDNDTIAHYPSNFWMDNVISVAALSSAAVNNLAAYSNYGLLSVDIAAVGDVETTEAGGGTVAVQGTSFATAQVSRAAALLFHQYPDATYYAVKYALVRGVDTLQSNDSIKIQSRGRLNLAKSMTVLDSLSLRAVCSNALFLDVPQVGSVATNSSVSIYPNPFSNRLQVEILNVEEDVVDLRLLSIEGALLWQYQLPAGQNSTTIPVEMLSPGMYILQIQGKTLRTTEKIVKFE
jgi:subtilisin family serine protease